MEEREDMMYAAQERSSKLRRRLRSVCTGREVVVRAAESRLSEALQRPKSNCVKTVLHSREIQEWNSPKSNCVKTGDSVGLGELLIYCLE